MSKTEEKATQETTAQETTAQETATQDKVSQEKEAPKAEVKQDKKQCASKLQARIKELEEEVEKQKAAVKDSKDDYLRLMAEFETFRRRTSEDRLNLVGSASAETIKGLLPVLDDCERALAILATSSDEAAKEGTELIYTKLMAYLKTKGLSVIEAKGQKFDVDFHEAVTQFPAADESQKGMVIDVVQTGYMLNDKVLRYAKVVVGA